MPIRCESFLCFFFSSFFIIKKLSLGELKQGAIINQNYYLTQYEIVNITGLIL